MRKQTIYTAAAVVVALSVMGPPTVRFAFIAGVLLPDWRGEWVRAVGVQWDPSKPAARVAGS
jgi:hypothetical protein